MLGDVPIFREEEDEYIWTGESSGLYTVKVWLDLALKDENNVYPPRVAAWAGVAPTRIQTFVWYSLKKKKKRFFLERN